MATLWTPPQVRRELAEESRRRETMALQQLVDDARWQWKREFDAQLERVMPGMRLLVCPDPAPLEAVAQGARPGHWHVSWPGVRGGPLNVQPLVLDADGEPRIGGEGSFVEPGSWVFDKLAEADMWNGEVMRERRRIQREAGEAKRRRKEIEAAEFDQETFERYRAVTRTQVSMNRETPWGQNARGARIARAEKHRRDQA